MFLRLPYTGRIRYSLLGRAWGLRVRTGLATWVALNNSYLSLSVLAPVKKIVIFLFYNAMIIFTCEKYYINNRCCFTLWQHFGLFLILETLLTYERIFHGISITRQACLLKNTMYYSRITNASSNWRLPQILIKLRRKHESTFL